jgi:hypothetical protein
LIDDESAPADEGYRHAHLEKVYIVAGAQEKDVIAALIYVIGVGIAIEQEVEMFVLTDV